MAAAPSKIPEPTTDFARKYGVYNVPPIQGTGKSGFTPVTPEPHKKASWRPEEALKYWDKRIQLEEFQAWRMWCWSARELQALHAHAAYGVHLPATLSNPIHPIYALKMWERKEDQYLHL